MRKLRFIYAALISLLISGATFAQNQNHPTVDKIKVGYKPVAVATATASSVKPQISVIPDVAVSLKSAANVKKIYLRIADKTSDNVIYQVNYDISSQAITDGQGVKLFYRDNLIVHIANPNTMMLDIYKYKVITEDAQGNQTVEFIAIQ